MNEIRKAGLKQLVTAGVIAVLIEALMLWLKDHGRSIVGIGWAIPAAFALTGLIQLVSGVPFLELSARWDSLKGWQRGILGTLIVIVAVALMMLGFIGFSTLFLS
ncbi:hypothetical protein [Roseateles depolymerans]|uniref:Uncharacterized protein n=1 Tax=Roseateles depolymerans TaxID=76731 RepID=A0A0U3CT66_9BURK|nr:hypothetical protein [Roseateles depolymerans]ALV04518.1 hypothetical protein RD2015_11 [Roseateles depolymerans]REG14049.1 hypothetical protein DES44_4061 [Roseateles depolymerans]